MAHHHHPSPAGTESPAGTTVTTVGPTINASPTPGSAGSGSLVAITPGGAISVNGTTVGGSNVIEIYYTGASAGSNGATAHSCYQENSSNAWFGPITTSSTGTAIADPRPTLITGITLSNAGFTGGTASGTVVGAISVSVSQGPAFSGTLSLSGTNASSFQISGANLETNGVVANGTYSINIIATQSGAIGSPFTQAETITGSTVTTVISGITLSNSSFTGGAASGTVIGAIGVTVSAGTWSGSLSLSGTNASDFQIVGTNLETSGVVAAGSYSINIIATQAGATGSPFTKAETITGASGGGFVFTPASTGSNGVLTGGYVLIFDEEFNGTAINQTANQWFVQTSGTFNNAAVTSANVSVSSSTCNLALSGSASSFTGAFIHTSGSTGNFFVSGANGSWYIEARIRMPAANSTGFWPAFWLNNAGATPEIDIAEWRGGFPEGCPRTYFNASGSETYHFGSFGDSGDTPTEADLGLGGVHLGAGYHIYGFLWQPGTLQYYIDGILEGTATSGTTQYSGTAISISNGPYAINLTAGANGYGGNNNLVSGTTTFPGVMKVDYVHVYQVGGSAVSPQTNYGGPGSTAGPTT